MWAEAAGDDCERKRYKGDLEFGGYLPACHPSRHCHHESLRKKGLLADIRTIMKKLNQLPACDQWDPLLGVSVIKRIPDKGPHRFGVYRPHGKPWDCNRVKSRELIGGKLIKYCDCCKKNGLQDECLRTQCKGKPWCMIEPLPRCPPFTNVPGYYEPPDPYDMCPEKPWLESPEYEAYQDMIKRSRMRTNEGCIEDVRKLTECI